MKMIKVSLLLTEEEVKWIEATSTIRGCSMTQVIRNAIAKEKWIDQRLREGAVFFIKQWEVVRNTYRRVTWND